MCRTSSQTTIYLGLSYTSYDKTLDVSPDTVHLHYGGKSLENIVIFMKLLINVWSSYFAFILCCTGNKQFPKICYLYKGSLIVYQD